MEKQKNSKNVFMLIFKIVIGVILGLYSFYIIYILSWGVLTSLKSDTDFSTFMNYLGLPSWEWSKDEILLGNYRKALELLEFDKSTSFYVGQTLVKHKTHNTLLTMFGNTILYAVIGAVLNTMTCLLVSYLACKYKFRFGKVIYLHVIISMSTPIIGAEASAINLIRKLGIYDTYWCIIFQKMSFGGMYFLVFYAFFEGLSDSYIEAAEIDGASQLKIFLNIIIPLVSKMILTISLVNFVAYWNDYHAQLLYTPTIVTLAYGVYRLCNEGGNAAIKHTPGLISVCMMLIVPILILFVFVSDKMMGSLTLGGVKE